LFIIILKQKLGVVVSGINMIVLSSTLKGCPHSRTTDAAVGHPYLYYQGKLVRYIGGKDRLKP